MWLRACTEPAVMRQICKTCWGADDKLMESA